MSKMLESKKLIGLVGLAVFAAASCGSTSAAVDTGVERIVPDVLEEVDDGAVLVVKIGERERTIARRDLENLELVRLEVHEPFLRVDTVFEGPTVDALIEYLGVGTEGTATLMALDDYTWDLPTADLVSGQAVIATREGGERIALGEGGPFRVVFPAGSVVGEELGAWVWSLSVIEFGY